VIRAGVAGVSVLVALTGCADRLVDVPTARPTATVVMLDDSGHCPSDTVLLGDDDPASGGGTIPAGFGGRLVLRCDVDYSTTTVQHGVERFTVRQWESADASAPDGVRAAGP
jgi:hypothetical protein